MNTIINLLGGGLLGSLTSLFTQWMKNKEKVADQEFELKKIKAESDAIIAEIQARVQIEQSITERMVQVEELKADVQEADGRSDLIVKTTGNYIEKDVMLKMISDNSWIGLIMRPFIYANNLLIELSRSIIRPFITVGSLLFNCYIFVTAWGLYSTLATVTPEQIMTLVIVPTIDLLVFISSTAVGFWFADKSNVRAFSKKH